MKTPHNNSEDTPKSSINKSSKKSSSKSRSKAAKSSAAALNSHDVQQLNTTNSASNNSTPKSSNASNTNSANHTSALLVNCNTNNHFGNNHVMATTPTTPTTSIFDSSIGSGSAGGTENNSSSSKNNMKPYTGLEPRSIKIFWEQHDQSDLELSNEVCARVAEDASYKLWELINNIKTYARHSGGVVTYDLVNEVMRDSDVPPALGAMDSDWDRIDYDGSYYFYSDKILELRDEYQTDVHLTLPDGPDFICSWPLEEKNLEQMKKYAPSLIYVALYGDAEAAEEALNEAANSPLIGSCYKLILTKLIQILALKQADELSSKCWCLLRALSANPQTRDIDGRLEYFHLSEILICQLLSPYECIKAYGAQAKSEQSSTLDFQSAAFKMEVDDANQNGIKSEFVDVNDDLDTFQMAASNAAQEDKIYKLTLVDDEDGVEVHQILENSPYFACPVDWKFIDELCQTLGLLAAKNGYFSSECCFHITRRLQRFFERHTISTEKEYNFVSRAVRGLLALGECAYREFIPYIYKLNAEDIPASLCNDFAQSAIFLKGSDDIFLYEWLEYVCGADKLQPFATYHAQYFEKFLTYRYVNRKKATYKITSTIGVRKMSRLLSETDEQNKSRKPKTKLIDIFPDLIEPNLSRNRSGNIRFKFAGCRPKILKPKIAAQQLKAQDEKTTITDIIIARRKLLKPLTNEKRIVPLSSYCFLNI